MGQNQQKTEKLEAELKALRLKLEKFKTVCDFSIDWEFWMGSDGQFIYNSPSCKALTGYTQDEFMGDSELFHHLVSEGDKQAFREYLKKKMDFTYINETITFRLVTRTRQIKWCEMSMKAVYDQRGVYLGQRGAIRDLTKAIQALSKTGLKLNAALQLPKIEGKADQEERKMTTVILKMAQKNELLAHIGKQLESMEGQDSVIKNRLDSIVKKINNSLSKHDEWEEFRYYFEKSHPQFFDRLQSRFPSLSPGETKLCAYLRLRLSNKEIAHLQNITPKSVEVGRTRLRKKLKIDHSTNLLQFLVNI